MENEYIISLSWSQDFVDRQQRDLIDKLLKEIEKCSIILCFGISYLNLNMYISEKRKYFQCNYCFHLLKSWLLIFIFSPLSGSLLKVFLCNTHFGHKSTTTEVHHSPLTGLKAYAIPGEFEFALNTW